MTETIKAIEEKGYIVKASENAWMGKIDESCPIVYAILNPDYTEVYGANGIAPQDLSTWSEKLSSLAANVSEPDASSVIYSAEEKAARAKKAADYDNLYNEGSEGYNPYRH